MKLKQLKSTSQNLKDLFDQNITVKYIAEPFKSFDSFAAAIDVKGFMDKHDYDTVGIRQNGAVTGYVKRADLQDGVCGNYLLKFDNSELLPDTTPLIEVLNKLSNNSCLYIVYLNEIVGIVTKGDFQKIPVRMWLFGLISLLEMQLLRLIRIYYPNDSWQVYLKQDRLDASKKLLDRRMGKNENLDLVDCLQFCDKRDIILKSNSILNGIWNESKTSTEKLLDDVINIRDNLAHAQDIITGFWPKVAENVEKIDKLLGQCEKVQIPLFFKLDDGSRCE